MLWLALVFPDLALESFPDLHASSEPWVLSAQGQVLACNLPALERGIHPGLRLSAAFALEPALRQRAHAPDSQQARLTALAEWALGFSAEVSLEGEQALLLEVGSTERYFGGLEILRRRLREGLAERGHRHWEACAPTPLAALWLAQGAPGTLIRARDALPEALGPLPLECCGLAPQTREALQGAGIQRLSALMALPAKALARRFGPELPALLRRALGHSPDPRQCLVPPRQFRRTIELAYPVQEVALLMGLLAPLIPDLADWGWRQAQVLTRIALILAHERRAASSIEIGFAGTRNPAHLRLIIEERLQAHPLDAPVVGLELRILASAPAPDGGADLLPAAPSRLREGQELLERLRARLGSEAVHGLASCADHRPERAWTYVEPGSHVRTGISLPNGPRPVWLLEQARDLGAGALPQFGGPLQLLAGPERIEGGWWDGQDVARDYFVASSATGAQYWVYRERRGEGRWFLQGLFA